MSIPGSGSPLLLATTAAAAADAGYVIPKSLRFNSGDSAYLSRADSSGNQKTFTVAFWIKKLKAQGEWPVIFSSSADSNNQFTLRWNNDRLQIYALSGGNYGIQLTPSRKFRDYSAWFHVVVSIDTTASTASDRVKIYFNGVQHTSGFDFTTTYPSQNENLKINVSGQTVNIGRRNYDAAQYADFLLADFQFVDGQALAPTDFGETRSSDGVWVPKEYTGSYGHKVNQTQNWTALGTGDATSPYRWEETFDGDSSTYGAIPPNGQAALVDFSSLSGGGISYTSSVVVTYNRNTNAPDVTVNGSAIGATADGTERTYTLSGSGTLTSVGTQTRTAGGAGDCGIKKIVVDGAELVDSGITLSHNGFHLNFSDSSTNEALGFDSAPTIPDLDPKKGMDIVTWTGNSTGQRNIGGLGFEPDFVWIKRRNASYGHVLMDSVRGFNSSGHAGVLYGNATNTEDTGNTQSIRSFNPDGFSLGTDGGVNYNGSTYVGWCWRAGGPAVSNTNGTINSQVSANTDYGFSIVSYTGNGSIAQTIGHGLSSAPKWIIAKNLDYSIGWPVYHSGVGPGNSLFLNTSGTPSGGTGIWGNVNPTNSVFTVANDAEANKNGDDYIAYCWSEVSGYSKFGSYTGSGSANKTVTGLGFKPRFVIIKRTDALENWQMVDSERGPDRPLFPDLTDAEQNASGGTREISFQDDGFTLVGTHAGINASGGTYIYAAFADRPGNNWDVNNIVTNEGLTTSKTQFDVVTYTGNGGTQKLGGPVFSNSADSGLTHADGVTGMFDGSLSTRGGAPSTDNSYKTLTDGASISASTGIRIYWNGVGAGQRYIRINGTTELDDGSAALTPGWSTQSSFSGTINKIEVKTASSGSWSLAAVEVDGTILIDGTGPGLKFQPDLIWVKARGSAFAHVLQDSVRGFGSTKLLSSSATAEENRLTDPTDGGERGYISGTSSTGFTIVDGTGTSQVNGNNETYVAWAWKAGGAAVSNTDGSITSSVSANAQYGFSIVSFTGTGANGSIGHGLNAAPELIIAKNRDSSDNWFVYHRAIGANGYIMLNQTSAADTSNSTVWQNVSPTSSVFYASTGGYNDSGDDVIAYCFANVPGYQRIGTYYSNSSDPTVITGFKPRFLLVKKHNGAGHWMLLDSQRSTDDDDIRTTFEINNSNAEETHANRQVKFLDNGFQLIGADMDTSNSNWLYWAIGDDEIGSDEDCLVDVPNAVTADADATDTTGGYQRGNYATLNPLVGGATLSNGNLDYTTTAKTATSTIGVTSGKYYAEVNCNDGGGAWIGITNNPNERLGSTDTNTIALIDGDGDSYDPSSTQSYTNYSGFSQGDVIGVALDATNLTVDFYKNGVKVKGYTAFTVDGPYFFAIDRSGTGTQVFSWNFGQMRFKYPMPSGYAALNTTALPAATIADGSAAFDVTLYSGNGGAQKIGGPVYSSNTTATGGFNSSYPATNLFNGTLSDSSRAEGNNNNGVIEVVFSPGITVSSTVGIWSGKSSVAYQINDSGSYTTYNDAVGSFKDISFTGTLTNLKIKHGSSGNAPGASGIRVDGTTLLDGTGESLSFSPGWVWIKNRNGGHNNMLFDIVRGAGADLQSNSTATEGAAGSNDLTSFDSSGFSLGSNNAVNQSGRTYVAWCWDAGTSTVSNTDGSITSSVRANPSAGFSVLTYTGTGSAGTVGHGLNAAPEMIILKGRNFSDNWRIYHKNLDSTEPEDYYMMLESLNQRSADQNASFMNDTAPTNSVFSLGTDSAINGSSQSMLAYCFTSVSGYSQIGSFEGNGNANGPFVYLGFRPAFLLVRLIEGANSSWKLYDSARDADNPIVTQLYANSSNAEPSDDVRCDFLSNGFKVRTAGSEDNYNNNTLIYYAVAENPFQANGGLAR